MSAEPFSYARTLPVVDARDDAWRGRAACLGHDPDLWDTVEGETPPAEALDTCRTCPVQESCLAEALSTVECNDHGLWAGTTVSQRRVLRRRMPRPQPTPTGCGTVAGYSQHSRDGELACESCKEANRRYHRDRRAAA